jgi:cell division septation protein DedD
MRNKDTGEFELVVGDKQLLSGFFIGVLLLAVVFAMGYVLGQNSPKSAKVPGDTAAAVPATSPSDSRPQPASPATADTGAGTTATPSTQTADTPQPAEAAPVEAPPQPTTVPARDAAAPAPAPAPPPAAKAAPDPVNATYWQVLAGSRNSAGALLQSLKGQGFPVSTRLGPNSLTLVWVGPYTDKKALSDAKKQLEDAGFTNLFKKP